LVCGHSDSVYGIQAYTNGEEKIRDRRQDNGQAEPIYYLLSLIFYLKKPAGSKRNVIFYL
jgi:hypothetical protein